MTEYKEARGKQGPERMKGMRIGRHDGAWAILSEGSDVVERGFPSERIASARMDDLRKECAEADWFLYRMPAR